VPILPMYACVCVCVLTLSKTVACQVQSTKQDKNCPTPMLPHLCTWKVRICYNNGDRKVQDLGGEKRACDGAGLTAACVVPL